MNSRNSPPIGRAALVSLIIAAAVALWLSWLCAGVVHTFFPYAEEWKIMLPSLPRFAEVQGWFTGFASIATAPYPAWAVNSINFIRPVMNVVYWLRGAWFGHQWGAYLYFNFAFIGIAAGAVFFCMRTLRDNISRKDESARLWLAVLLLLVFIVMPPMVSQTSRFLPVILPQMAFGRLLGAFVVLACLSYGFRRYWIATGFLILALLTKEQAAPVAIALPLTFAWTHRRQWRSDWPWLLLLVIPIAAWVAARLLLFGSVAGHVYVLMGPDTGFVHQFIGNLLKLPFFAGSLHQALYQPFSLHALLVICNLLVLAYLIGDNLLRCWRKGPDVYMIAALGYWLFLAIVGLNPRYGTPIIALSVLLLARPAAVRLTAPLRPVALAALLVTGAGHAYLSWQSFPVHVTYSQKIYAVGEDYAQALAQAGPHPVVVLNDPNTMFTAPSDMATVLGLPPTAVYKASDYPWQWPAPAATQLPEEQCHVTVRVPVPGKVVFKQSCGLQIMGALAPNEDPLVLPLANGITVRYPKAHMNSETGYMAMGDTLVLRVTGRVCACCTLPPRTRPFI